ncbi:TPA: hypothetical protein ACOGGX_002483, partial [Staphylococcus aureus]
MYTIVYFFEPKKSSLPLLFYFATLDIKKETLRSQCGSSHPFFAWQRSTLAERKLATFVAK